MRRAALAHLRTLGHRYAAVAVAAGFLAVLVTWFPSTSSSLSNGASPVPVRAGGPPAGGGSTGTASPSGTKLGAELAASAPSVGLLGLGSSFAGNSAGAAPFAAGVSTPGNLGGAGSGPSGGLAPAPIHTAPGGSSMPRCPLPAVAVPGTAAVPEVDALLQAVHGLCTVLAGIPELLPELPAILADLPGALRSGTLPGPLDAVVQQLAFDVVIPLLSALPLPATIPGADPVQVVPGLALGGNGLGGVLQGAGVVGGFALADPVRPGPAAAAGWSARLRWPIATTFGLVAPSLPPPGWVDQIAAAARAGVPITVVAVPDSGGPGLLAWAGTVARHLPGDIDLLLAVRPVATKSRSGALLPPATIASVLAALHAGDPAATTGLAVTSGTLAPPARWWAGLSALRRAGAGTGLIGVLTTTAPDQPGCPAVAGLADGAAIAGLSEVSEVVATEPGPTSVLDACAAAGARGGPAADPPLVLQAPLVSGRWRT